MPQTPRQLPQVRQSVRMVSCAPATALGLVAANGPARSARRNRFIAALSRSRHSRLTFGLASCPSKTNASASMPGSCGTTIVLPPVGFSPLCGIANHSYNAVGQSHFAGGQGAFSRYLGHSAHSAQPDRIAATAWGRSASVSSAVITRPTPVITVPMVPFSSMSISRRLRDRQRKTERLVRFRDRNATAWASTWALNDWVLNSGGSIAPLSHTQADSRLTAPLRQTVVPPSVRGGKKRAVAVI